MPQNSLLIYDGDCAFCKYWVDYWQSLTDDRVDYAPFQEAEASYPEISRDQFKKAIQYVAPDGKIASAAEASFRVLSHAPGKGFWLKLYQHMPGFAIISEKVYAFIARRRSAFYRISLFLWGRNHQPPRFDVVSWLFLRGLGLIFLSAFISFALQAKGLIGEHGILPLRELMAGAMLQLGPTGAHRLIPMIFWLDGSDRAIAAVCWGGAFLSILLTWGVLQRLVLPLLCILYLSLISAGQAFMTFQWDVYLVETCFIAFMLCLSTETGIWLLRWLLFRFMFMGGAVKLLSGDATWRNFTALNYHFLTQPLPTPLAWYAYRLPHGVLAFCTGATLFIELVLPFFIFLPRRLRFAGVSGIILLQILIALTGNYNFFNLTTLILCLTAFDDAAVSKILPKFRRPELPGPHRVIGGLVTLMAVWTILVSAIELDERFGNTLPPYIRGASQFLAPYAIVNTYGPFATMTTQRQEIVVEGSDDGITWKEYGFRYKPGNVSKPLSWNIPHQPRLDWQMWFAALGPPEDSPWFANFLLRLLQNQPEVTSFLAHNPFPDKPPRYVRAILYNYRFSTFAERKQQHVWWVREPVGLYFPVARLSVKS